MVGHMDLLVLAPEPLLLADVIAMAETLMGRPATPDEIAEAAALWDAEP
jgi:hypothetical protein